MKVTFLKKIKLCLQNNNLKIIFKHKLIQTEGGFLLRYAIISDIHSNLEALQSVLNKIEDEKVDKIVCLGDIVGYGPNPNECLALVQQHCEIILTGNHDFACIESSELFYFNNFAKEAIEWTVNELPPEHLTFIAKLPFVGEIEDYYLVHSNPHDPRSWDYILYLDEAIYNFSKFTNKICFIGHSHYPVIYLEYFDNNRLKYNLKNDTKIQLYQNNRYIINVGSVGQPRDGNPAAAFGIVDTSRQTYQLVRVEYDINKIYQKMMSGGLPQFLAERLFTGR